MGLYPPNPARAIQDYTATPPILNSRISRLIAWQVRPLVWGDGVVPAEAGGFAVQMCGGVEFTAVLGEVGQDVQAPSVVQRSACSAVGAA